MSRIFHNLDEARGQFGPAAITIGVFDVVHLGHQRLVRTAIQRASELGIASGAVTFHPHPRNVLGTSPPVRLLIPVEERIAILRDMGIEKILVLPFDLVLSRLTPEDFVRWVLRDALDVRFVVVGENFHFGYRQAGTIEVLGALGAKYGIETRFLPQVRCRGSIVSSSLIREYVSSGAVSRAGRMLGRCYGIEGEVVSGQGIGSKQTVPTLNLAGPADFLLAHGVYITEVQDLDDGRSWPAVTNVGTRPTFSGTSVTIESFLLAPLVGGAPKRIRVQFRRWIRGERKFPDASALRAQILADVSRAEAYWRRVRFAI